MHDNNLLNEPTASVEHHLVYSYVWQRVVAFLLDGVIIGLSASMISSAWLTFPDWLSKLVELAIEAIYFVVIVKHNGATPAKMILRLKIIKTDGTGLTWTDACVRYLPFFLVGVLYLLPNFSFFDIPSYEGVPTINEVFRFATATAFSMATLITVGWYLATSIVMLTDKQRQALHDKIAGTVVIQII